MLHLGNGWRTLLQQFFADMHASAEHLQADFRHRTAMVEARVRRLPGYIPMPDHDDGVSEAGAFLWRLGDAFELWDEQGDALEEDEMRQECQPDAQPAGPPEVRVHQLLALRLWDLWLM